MLVAPQTAAAMIKPANASNANQLRAGVIGINWSSCSGVESRSSAT
jgi:hypothetical protein